MAREWGKIVNDQYDALTVLAFGEPSEAETIDALRRLADGYKERLESAVDNSCRYFDSADEWRDKYIAMRQERNEAMDRWFNSIVGQWDWEAAVERDCKSQRNEAAKELWDCFQAWLTPIIHGAR